MKTKTTLTILLLISCFATKAQEKSACEKELESGKIKIVNPDNNKWNEVGNSYQNGKFSSKIITFCCHADVSTKRGYPVDYKISRWDKLNIYYFNFAGKEYQYASEKEAAFAIYTLDRCNVVLQQGKISEKNY